MAATTRQFDLLRLLRAPEPFSLLTLARRMGVAKNTVQRDLDHLSNAGVGITDETRGQTIFYRLGAEATTPHLAPVLDAATTRAGAGGAQAVAAVGVGVRGTGDG
ncbi:MAG: helix-turn-helix domain-containing protein [Rhodoglobus sp.]